MLKELTIKILTEQETYKAEQDIKNAISASGYNISSLEIEENIDNGEGK